MRSEDTYARCLRLNDHRIAESAVSHGWATDWRSSISVPSCVATPTRHDLTASACGPRHEILARVDRRASVSSSDSDGQIGEYAWDFDDDGLVDTTTSDPGTTHTYSESGTYTVTLTVTDDDGATATSQQDITVGDSGSDGTRILTLESSDGSRVEYEFTVSGDTLEKSTEYDGSINSNDTISGSSANGTVVGGRDSYEFSGDVSSISADGDLVTYIDGEQVDLS